MRNIPLSDLTVARSGDHTVISIGDNLRHIGPEVGIFYEKALDLSAQGFNRRQVACIMNIPLEEVARLATGNRPYPEIHVMNTTDLQELDDIEQDVTDIERVQRNVDHLIGIQVPAPGHVRRPSEEVRRRIANQTMRMSQPKARTSGTIRVRNDSDDTLFYAAPVAAVYVASSSSDSDTCSRPSDDYSSPSYDSPSSSGSDNGGSSCD